MLLEVDGIVKSYGNIKAVQNISFAVHKGEIFGLIGPNGAGKTSILEIIEGVRRADSGTVKINSKQLDREERARLLGVQFQENALFDLMTVEETIEFFSLAYNLEDIKYEHLLAGLGLSGCRRKMVNKLSAGQQRRLCILLAFLHQPVLVILDEPSSGLDPVARRELWDFIRNYVNNGNRAVLMSTHYMDEAEILCDRVALINRGYFVGIGAPKELVQQNNLNEVISFRREKGIEKELFTNFADIKNIDFTSKRIIIETDNAYALLRKLLDKMEKKKLDIYDLQVRRANLEDVFLKNAREEFKK